MKFRLYGILLLVFSAPALPAQILVGWNVAPLINSTFEFHGFIHPKNEDWLSFTIGGGYTMNSPFLLDKKEECLKNVKHGGYHFRAGARMQLTTDHHSNYFFWGASAVYTRHLEKALLNTCNSSLPLEHAVRRFGIVSGAVYVGYSWNPLRPHIHIEPLQLDFGFQLGFPLATGGEFFSKRNYISGLGYGNLPIRSLNLELIAMARFELAHFKYGYMKTKKVKK